VSSRPVARTTEVRHLQLVRALLAALAAAMITFTADHSAGFGLAVFSGFTITTGLVMILSGWVVYTKGTRATAVGVGVVSAVAGLVTGVPAVRSITMFFVVVIGWAVVTGLIEGISGLRGMRRASASPDPRAARSDARDGLVVGAITLLLGLGLLLVPAQYALNYTITEAHRTFTLTGIAIAVGVFGGYAAVIAVYLGIAGFSPRRSTPAVESAPVAAAHPDSEDPA
jgi:hypothetical protein